MAVEGDGLVKVEDRVLELASVTVAAGTVVPVNCILLVKLDCCCEVIDGVFEFQEPVPDESSAVVRRRIFRVKLDDLVEVLEAQLESVPTYLLSNCAKMVHGLYIARLELYSG